MSVDNPNPSERKIIVSTAIDDFLKANPQWINGGGKPEDDLDRFFKGFAERCLEVDRAMKPIIQLAIDANTIHSAAGRKQAMMTVHKMFMDKFLDYNKDELRFLLAYMQSKMLLAEYV